MRSKRRCNKLTTNVSILQCAIGGVDLTRQQLMDRCLEVVGDSTLTTQASEWLDNILLEIDGLGYWRFNEATDTIATTDGAGDYAQPTTYSKGLIITPGTTGKPLLQVPLHTLLDARSDSATGTPTMFSLFKDRVYVYPTPVIGSLPVLQCFFFEQITLPTDNSTDIQTLVGIKKKWHKYLLDGMIAQGLKHIDDERQSEAQALWQQDIVIMMADNEEFVTPREKEMDRPTEVLKPREQ